MNKRTNSSYGFTLIEILVSIALIAIVAATTIPNLKQFNETQVLTGAAQDMASAFRVAQSNAQLGALCPSGKTPLNWFVKLSDSTTGYQLGAVCLKSDNSQITEIKSSAAYQSTAIHVSATSCGSYPLVVSFVQNTPSATCGGSTVSLPQGITLIDSNVSSNNQKTICIDKGGAINIKDGSTTC